MHFAVIINSGEDKNELWIWKDLTVSTKNINDFSSGLTDLLEHIVKFSQQIYFKVFLFAD